MCYLVLCYFWLSFWFFDEGIISKWKDCCIIVDYINGVINYFFLFIKVVDWFYDFISIVLLEI